MENHDGIVVSIQQETRTQDLLNVLRPNVLSDKMRETVIHYIQRLIRENIGTEVFPFGSLPLKTYFPDEAIDFTLLIHPTMEKNLMNDIVRILEEKEQHTQLMLEKEHNEFLVDDVQFLGNQDKILYCRVSRVPVQISINQVAGLSTFCFLEQVDKYIGRDHIFKKSVILIKSWCYYESRTFGACHGLLSLYALETMVLYIINAFHSSLQGPLAVFYKFLDYYGKFDWDNYCVSINGPVAISSLPEIAATPENEGIELLLTQDFLRFCRMTFSVPAGIPKTSEEEFSIMHLNVIDPLHDTNNLGFNIRIGSFFRIRCAFALGARHIRRILTLPEEGFGIGLQKIFVTFNDLRGGERPDVQAAVSASDIKKSDVSDLNGDYDRYYSYFLYGKWYHRNLVEKGRTMMSGYCDQSAFSRQGSGNFAPGTPFYHLDAGRSYATPIDSKETDNSQGNGTHDSDMSHVVLGDVHLGCEARKPATGSSKLMLGTQRQLEKGISAFLIDLSIKEFPPLPTKTDQSTLLPTESSHQEHPSAFLGTIQFGSISASEFSVLREKKLANSDDLPVLASTLNGPPRKRLKEDEKQNDSAKSSQPYNLDRDMDFPRLP